MTAEMRERDQRIEQLERQLQETVHQQRQTQVSQDDPEYTVDDFRKVRDEHGNIHDLDNDQAELAWRRWKDGYDQRTSERQAEANRQEEAARQEHETTQRLMQSSADAYDTLTDILENYSELNSESPDFDSELTAQVLPIIQNTIIYVPGTEPGNPERRQPVIAGMRMNPNDILEVIRAVRTSRRSMPLNGIMDSVESASTVGYTKARSSDPTINAANELYKELGIKTRL